MVLWSEPNESSIKHHVYIFMQYVTITKDKPVQIVDS